MVAALLGLCALATAAAVRKPPPQASAPVRLYPAPARVLVACRREQRRAGRLEGALPDAASPAHPSVPAGAAAPRVDDPPEFVPVGWREGVLPERLVRGSVGAGQRPGMAVASVAEPSLLLLALRDLHRGVHATDAHGVRACRRAAGGARWSQWVAAPGACLRSVLSRRDHDHGYSVWCNHVGFVWRRGAAVFVASLHYFGPGVTARLLARLVGALRPATTL
jgi:hypothetical protein